MPSFLEAAFLLWEMSLSLNLINDLPAENKLFFILAIFTNVARICLIVYGERDGKLGDFKWADFVVQNENVQYNTNESVPLCFVFFPL